uniref:FBA_2 domain-containing protein n=1 Tax=Panagrellus redivivus TaxID=6233 RepID=A0A7E4VX95_PANRE
MRRSPIMYPLSTYSYSFQRRLRELASPIEAYNLQVADIDETIHLSPRVQLTTFDTLEVSTKSTSDGMHVRLLNSDEPNCQLHPTMLFNIKRLIINKNRDLTQLASLKLEKRIIPKNDVTVLINKCVVDKKFLKMLKSWIAESNCTYFAIDYCVFTKEVTVGLMDNLFASVKRIQHFHNSYRGHYLADLCSVLIREPSVDSKLEEYYNKQGEMFLDANLNLTLKDAISLWNYNKASCLFGKNKVSK